MPRIVLFEERVQRVRQPSTGKVGERDDLEHAAQSGPGGDPQVTRDRSRLDKVEILWGSAAHVGERAFDRADDISNADLGCGSGQPVAAVMTTLAGDDAGAPRICKESLDEAKRDLLMLGDGLALQPRARLKNCELKHGADCVVDSSSHTHGLILARKCLFEFPLAFPTD